MRIVSIITSTFLTASVAFAADVLPSFNSTITGGDEAVKADVYSVGGKNRIATDPLFTVTQTPGVPSFSSKLRSIYSSTPINLTNPAYTTIYSYSGNGRFVGFIFDFDKIDVKIRLKIDGETVFDLDADWIEAIQIPNGSNYYYSAGGPFLDTSAKKVAYNPAYPIIYNSSVLVEAMETSGDSVMERYIITLTQE